MGKTIRNPDVGHRITFLQTADQTNGELLQIMYAVEAPEIQPVIPFLSHQVFPGQIGTHPHDCGNLSMIGC